MGTRKALSLVSASAPIADATQSQELSNATNVVKDFENPKPPEEKSSTNPDIRFLRTTKGDVLGFEYNGEIFLLSDDPSVLTHEYTHVWDKVIQTKFPEEYKEAQKLRQTDPAAYRAKLRDLQGKLTAAN